MTINVFKANMASVTIGSVEILFSYKTTVGIASSKVVLLLDSFCSVTTSKHINQWLRNKGTHEKIKVSQELFDAAIRSTLEKAGDDLALNLLKCAARS